MGSIKNFIEKIKSARYGKDVRQSIVDAIEQTYDDAIANGHTDMEVAKARGKHSSLNNRLETDKNEMETRITNEEDDRKRTLEDIQKQVNGLAREGHLIASNVSEMTDTNRTYINTSDGHWYYYNGKWKDGGVYQATEIQKKSINLDKLNNDVINFFASSMEKEISEILPVIIENGNYYYPNNTTNKLSKAVRAISNTTIIDVNEGDMYDITCTFKDDKYNSGYGFVDNAGNVVFYFIDTSLTKIKDLSDYRVTIPSGVVKMYVNRTNTYGNPVVKKITPTYEYTSKIGNLSNLNTDEKSNLVDTINEVNNKLKQNNPKTKILFNYDDPGLIYTDGRHELMIKYKIPYSVNVTVVGEDNVIYPGRPQGQNYINDLIKDGVDFAIYSSYLKPEEDSVIYNSGNEDIILQFETYIETAKKEAEKVGIFNPTAWFSRYNRTGTAMNQALINKGFKICRGYKFGTDESAKKYFNISDYKRDDRDRFNVVTLALYPSTYDNIIESIDYAIANHLDLSIFTHKIYDTEEEANSSYGITYKKLESCLAYIRQKIDTGECEAMTYREYYKTKYLQDGLHNDQSRMFRYFDFRMEGK